jgi:fibronectin type 3 domain-containing protein
LKFKNSDIIKLKNLGGVILANIKSAKKRILVNRTKADRNKAIRSTLGIILVALTVIFTMSLFTTSSFAIGATLQPPTELSASQTTSSLTIKWKAADSATGYRIYRYDSSTKTYKTVATTTNLSYTVKSLKSATNYTFRIKSYKKLSDGTTLWSGYRALTTATRPVAPLINSLTSSSKGKVTLKWTNVARESGYQIYYSTSKTGTYKLLDTTKVNDVSETCGGLKSGRTYYFKVRAFKTVNGNRIYSSFSPAKGIKIK